MFQWVIDEALHSGEANDGVKFSIDLSACSFQDGTTQVHILPAGQFRVETSPTSSNVLTRRIISALPVVDA